MLEFGVEWEDAGSWVRSPTLAATWGKLEIRAGGQLVTRFWSAPGNTVRSGIYASAFPLAAWIVRNWWNLLHERLPAPEVLRGARHAPVTHRAWLGRHNLVFSREGMAYPDLAIYREDESVGLRWVPDPGAGAVTTPGRFLSGGFLRLAVPHAEAAMAQLVDAVVDRLDGLEDRESIQLREDWRAVQQSTSSEAALCARLGALGMDPYGASNDPALEEALDAEDLEAPLLGDLLAATSPSRFHEDLDEVRLFLKQMGGADPHHGAATTPSWSSEVIDPLPYRAGYQRAEDLRRKLHLDPFSTEGRDPTSIAKAMYGGFETSEVPSKNARRVEAVVARNGKLAVTTEARAPLGARFLRARALHHWLFVDMTASGRRLLTRANDWQQAASRAFAAELLAPAVVLAKRLDGRTDWDADGELAAELNVHPTVIARQLENHGLS